MNDSFDPAWSVDTLGIRAAELRSQWGEHSPGIFATSSFCFDSAEQAQATFAEQRGGYIYSRFTNPTVAAFEQRLAAMEGGDACVATASGMAAILSLSLTLLKQGDHVIASRTLFGSTISLFNNYVAKFGVRFSYVDPCDLDAWREQMGPDTKMLFVETPTNPLGEIVDLRGLADIAHRGEALLVVDNCFLTPALQRPLSLGADLVMHSATKYLDGQGRCVGGAIVGDAQRVGKQLFGFMRTCGPCMSPFNAWVFLKGLETLNLRMRAHGDGAQRIAEWLAQHPAVAQVHYAGLASHPQHELAKAQQSGFGGIVSFELHGGQAAAFRMINATRLLSITANLGDTRSTVTHPATTTHLRIGPELRERAGIRDGLVRLSIGLEGVDDLIADLEQALV
ncbi:O-succinylhomoserine sulfhydrylase [Algiphilus sp. W345]|uniref:O-succinylhomoserine sulfhydrylase n=1 Tax=Banduia mediterranea TaxID=3075609 RepID=A0ABU2WJJ5_9GAMM|nr:O-succinylhomoserine sulfhydrylase [Algiphilus sp. W345]MDT0498053.1 O-succinylhomoserine sulfhydrylase [Algiphilus sp. W345]